MTEEKLPPKSSRRFSKWMLVINVALAWAAVFVSIIYAQAEAVSAAALGLIGILFTSYVGIGHMDLRKILETQIRTVFKRGSDAG